MLIYREIVLIVLFSFVITSCQETPSTRPPDTTPTETDFLIAQICGGVFMRLDSLKNSYTLDEQIQGVLSITNNDTLCLPVIRIGNYPPLISYLITDTKDSMVYNEPMIIGAAVYIDTLRKNEALSDKVYWSQNIWSKTVMISSLKAFSGKYKIETNFRGCPDCVPLRKWITITEFGNPLSAAVEKVYNIPDSIKFSFIVRNRISSVLNYQLQSSEQIQVVFIKNIDTVLTQSFMTQSNQLQLPAHSDTKLFQYDQVKTHSSFNGFKGSYKLIVKVRFVSGEISASTNVYF